MAIVTDPDYPLPGEHVSIVETSASGDTQVLEITSRPSASVKPLGYLVKDTVSAPTTTFDIVENELETNSTSFDEPGEYGVSIYDLRRWDGVPSFPDDPSGKQRWELIATFTGIVNVSAPITLPLLSGDGQGANLLLAVYDEVVRAASLTNFTDEKARTAALQSTVINALIAIVGQTVAAMGTDLQTGLDNLVDSYEAHRVLVAGSVHNVADVTNAITRGGAWSQEGAISLLNELQQKLLQHMQDSTASSSRWHNQLEDDLKNLPLAGPAISLAAATVLLADLRERVYERHRVQTATPNSHSNPDSINSLTGSSPLDDIIVAYFDALAIVDPTAVDGEPEGAVDAAHRYGFEKV